MIEILESNVFIGNKDDIENVKNDVTWVVIHATRTDFETRIKSTHLPPINFNENARFFEIGNHFYLNWIDVLDPNSYQLKDFEAVFNFIDRKILIGKKIFIYCDYSMSRSVGLCMFYLAKRLKILPDNYYLAVIEFENAYPGFDTSSGIGQFISEFWDFI